MAKQPNTLLLAHGLGNIGGLTGAVLCNAIAGIIVGGAAAAGTALSAPVLLPAVGIAACLGYVRWRLRKKSETEEEQWKSEITQLLYRIGQRTNTAKEALTDLLDGVKTLSVDLEPQAIDDLTQALKTAQGESNEQFPSALIKDFHILLGQVATKEQLETFREDFKENADESRILLWTIEWNTRDNRDDIVAMGAAMQLEFATVIERLGGIEEGVGRIETKLDAALLAGHTAESLDARFSLPQPPIDFSGRETELNTLRRTISCGAMISGVRGMGGVGKTVLALVLAHELKDNFGDARIFLDLKGTATGEEQPLTPVDAMSRVIRAFHPNAELPEKDQEIAAIYRSVLDGKQALLLFDNARDRSQVQPLIPPDGCFMLVTSRVKFTLPGLAPFDLNVMDPGEAADFLCDLCPRIKELAGDLARHCGFLPLALRLAGSALSERKDLSVDRYMQRLSVEENRIAQLDRYESDEEAKVAASIALSEAMLDESLRDRWRMLGVFPGGFFAAAAAAVWDLPLDSDEAADALSEIRRLSLIEWDDASSRYRLHDLIRAYVRGCIEGDARSAAARRHAEHFGALLASADHLYIKGGEDTMAGLGIFDIERDNIEAGFAWAERRMADGDESVTRLCCDYPSGGPHVLSLRLSPQERISWLELQAAAAKKLNDEARMAGAYGNLGCVLEIRGDLDGAEAMHRKSLEINEKLDRLEGMANNYGNLGIVMKTRGDLDGAEAMYRKSLEIEEKLGRLEGMASDYCNLGTLMRIRGDLDGAEAMYRKSLEIEEKLGRLEGMANNYGNLGIVMNTRGDLDGAEAMYRKSLEIEEKLGRLEGMANQYGNLGILMRIRGDLDGAEAMNRKSLEINEKLGRLEGMAIQYGNLGNVMQTRGDLDGAEAMHRKSLQIEEKLGRLEGMAIQYGNLGNVMQARGDLDGAEAMFRKSLEIEEKLGGLEGMASDYGNLGLVMKTRGDPDGARQFWTKSRDLFDQLGAHQMVEKVQGWIDDLPE